MAISKVWEKGAEGGIELAEKLLHLLDTTSSNFKPLYDVEEGIKAKIAKIAKEIYGANGVTYDRKANLMIKRLERLNLASLPICMAKTQYSLSDQASLLGRPTDFTIHISDIIVSAGAGFIVAISGDIMRMPGLPKAPAAIHMDIDANGKISGLF